MPCAESLLAQRRGVIVTHYVSRDTGITGTG